MTRLADRRALVTGATGGIGKAIALAFAAEGADVAVGYVGARERRTAARVVRDIERLGRHGVAIAADLSVPAQAIALVRTAIEALGGIDILVNNAGICPWRGFLGLDLSTWEKTQAVNHRAVFLCSQAVAKHLVRRRQPGAIVTISSVGAHNGNAFQAHYNASKAAASSLMRSMAVALGPHGIRCNVVSPGCIQTPLNARVLNAGARRAIVRRTPLGRIGGAEDVVAAAVFLASDEGRFCTGAEIIVDGGISISG